MNGSATNAAGTSVTSLAVKTGLLILSGLTKLKGSLPI